MTEKETLVYDIETFQNYTSIGFKRISDGKVVLFEQSDRSEFDFRHLRSICRSHTLIGFNSNSFDRPLLAYILEGAETWNEAAEPVWRPRTCAEIKRVANRIISERMKFWEVERNLGVTIPREWDQIDLIEPQPNPFASLKILNGRMHGRWMRDLPYPHDRDVTHEQMDRLNEYLVNDLEATESLWHTLAEPMALRRELGKSIGRDLRSMSDTQMGMAIIKQRCEDALGRRIRREGAVDDLFSYEVPPYVEFQTPHLRDILEKLRAHRFELDNTGKARLPDFLLDSIRIGNTEYQMGIGGLHSTESNRSVREDYRHVLLDADCASYYPAIILSLGLYPPDIGPVFLDVYRQIRDDRVAAKKEAKALKKAGSQDKARLNHLSVIDKGLKIALNGCFGSLGSPYKIVYAPHLLISVTLTGQLALLMLIERAEAAGIEVVSANTDGVLFRCPRHMFDGIDGDRLRPSALEEITSRWEQETQFDLEFVRYRGIYNLSVNSYFAIKHDGGHKRKGPLANPWNPHPDDFDPVRGQLMKNPQTPICSDAALNYIKHGTPIRETIRGCTDVRQFVTVIKVTSGATWRDDYLGKVVRYYYGRDGSPILEAEPNALGNFKQVSRSEGAVPLMTMPDDYAVPPDIDYERYEQMAEDILVDVGFYGTPYGQLKMGRMTRLKRERLEPWLLTA